MLGLRSQRIVASAPVNGCKCRNQGQRRLHARAADPSAVQDDNDMVFVDPGQAAMQPGGAADYASPDQVETVTEEEDRPLTEEEQRQLAAQQEQLKVRRDMYSDLLDDNDDMAARGIPRPLYYLNVLYLDKAIGMAVDQQLASGERGPVTEYFWWPDSDAWDMLNEELKAMAWMDQQQVIGLLNVATDVINYWQAPEGRPSLEEVRVEFPNVTFFGA